MGEWPSRPSAGPNGEHLTKRITHMLDIRPPWRVGKKYLHGFLYVLIFSSKRQAKDYEYGNLRLYRIDVLVSITRAKVKGTSSMNFDKQRRKYNGNIFHISQQMKQLNLKGQMHSCGQKPKVPSIMDTAQPRFAKAYLRCASNGCKSLPD